MCNLHALKFFCNSTFLTQQDFYLLYVGNHYIAALCWEAFKWALECKFWLSLPRSAWKTTTASRCYTKTKNYGCLKQFLLCMNMWKIINLQNLGTHCDLNTVKYSPLTQKLSFDLVEFDLICIFPFQPLELIIE